MYFIKYCTVGFESNDILFSPIVFAICEYYIHNKILHMYPKVFASFYTRHVLALATWFLKTAFSPEVSMCVCVCVHPQAIKNHEIKSD